MATKVKYHLETDDKNFKFKLFELMEEVRFTFIDPMLLDITIEPHKKTRTNLQNRYYWFIVNLIAEEVGYIPDIMHGHLKKLLSCEEFDMPDGSTHSEAQSTKYLTTVEFEDYLSRIRQWASDFLNMYIPLPNETPYNYLEVK